jgi:hypothetical protein
MLVDLLHQHHNGAIDKRSVGRLKAKTTDFAMQ